MRALALAALLPLALPALAAPPTPLRQAQISAALHARGRAEGDALMILTAAALRKSLALADDAHLPLDWRAMLAEAEALAAADPALLAAIADLRADTNKGVAAGPVYRLAALGPGAEASITDLAFRGGSYAEVYVEAASANLDLTVRDAEGRLICADTDPGPIAYCGWIPGADGVFLLTISNRGPAASDYAVMTN